MGPADDLFSRAMQPPESERADLAYLLIHSLETTDPDPDHDAAWVAEVDARLRSIDEGRTTPIGWDEVKTRLRESLSRVRAS